MRKWQQEVKLEVTEQEIIEALKANQPFRGLPDVRLAGLELQPRKGLARYDVAFRLESGANGVIVYGEIKNTCTPKTAQEIAPWLARIKAAQPDTAVAIICPALSPEAQAICIENKIDFIDLAGNISINVSGKFLLQRLGQKGQRLPRLQRNPYSGKSSRVLRVLLKRPQEWTLTEIAKELERESQRNPVVRDSFEISLASISKTLGSLEEELLVRRRNKLILVPEPRLTLLRWAEKYKERYRWRLRSSFKCPNPFGKDSRIVTKRLNQLIGSSGFAFTGAAAATITAPFVDVDTIDIFVSGKDIALRIREIKPTVGVGPDLRVIFPYDIGVFMYADLNDDLPLVSDIQAFLDLFARGGRDFKQAEYLLQEKIEPSWRKA